MADIEELPCILFSLPPHHESKPGPSKPSSAARELAPDFGPGLYKLPGDTVPSPKSGNNAGSADKSQKQTHGHGHATKIMPPYYGPHCHENGPSSVAILPWKG
jgi:hypothetical protein